jgi:hypothetical protein
VRLSWLNDWPHRHQAKFSRLTQTFWCLADMNKRNIMNLILL